MKMKNYFYCFKFKCRIFQYLAAFAANLGMLSIGLHYGWPSSSIPILTNGKYTFQMTSSEISWLVAVTPLGVVIGDILAAFALNFFGKKEMIWYCSIPLTVSWLLIALADSSIYLFVARTVVGIVDGILFTAIPPYLAEISDPEIRGFIGTTYYVAVIFGMLLYNVMLFFISMPTAAYISGSVSVLMLIMLPFLPESPYYHLIKKEMSLGKAGLQKLRGKEDVTEELERITNGIIEEEKYGKGSFKELISKSYYRTCLLLALGMSSVQQLSGYLAIQSYCETVFIETNHILAPDIANIIYFVLYFLATLVALILLDICGRKPLILFSTIVVCLTLFTIATYLYMKKFTDINLAGYEYVQIIAVFVFISAHSIGLNCVPVLVSSEIFPAHIKGKAFCVLNMFFSIITTVVIQYFSWTNDNYGLYLPFYTFGVFTFLGLIFLVIYLPETKAKTLEDIQLQMRFKKEKVANATVDSKL